MSVLEGKVGQVEAADGSFNPSRQGNTGEAIVGQAHGRYQEAVLRDTYLLSTANAGGMAYIGAAGGTPLIGLHNPANSGKNLVLLFASIGIRASASAAGQVTFGIWGGPSVIPTGTVTVPTRLKNLTAGGAVSRGYVNTAMTGSTALSFIMSIRSYYWATAASSHFGPNTVDLGGIIVVVPGNQIAIGASTIPSSMTNDATLIWEEVKAY